MFAWPSPGVSSSTSFAPGMRRSQMDSSTKHARVWHPLHGVGIEVITYSDTRGGTLPGVSE